MTPPEKLGVSVMVYSTFQGAGALAFNIASHSDYAKPAHINYIKIA